jgi:hypothetical protein
VALIDTRKIGAKGGKARAANLSAKELSEAARTAVNARWEQYYRDHPEKLKERKEREASAKARRKRGKKGTKGK